MDRRTMTTTRSNNSIKNDDDGKSLESAILLSDTDDDDADDDEVEASPSTDNEFHPNTTTLQQQQPQQQQQQQQQPTEQKRPAQDLNSQDILEPPLQRQRVAEAEVVTVAVTVPSPQKSTRAHAPPLTHRNSPAANKNDNNTANIPSSKVPGDIPIMADCPIKLFATQQDMILRQTKSKHHCCWTHCWTLREMLGLDRNAAAAAAIDPIAYDAIEWLVISNFQIDFTFLLDELPELLSIPTTLVIYDNKLNSEATWKMCASPTSTINVICRNPAQPPRSAANPLSVKLPWGCHHTKLFLVGYASGKLRVIVHTANLRYNDIHCKTQGAYLQDFWPKSSCAVSTATATATTSSTSPPDFEQTLIAYLKTYQYDKKHTWRKGSIIDNGASSQDDNNKQHCCTLVELLQTYDFSTALGVLIPSSPGYHKPKDFHKWGYLKVRHAIVQHTTIPSSSSRSKTIPSPPFQSKTSIVRPSSPAIVCQFSSIGSLSKKYLTTLEAAWDVGQVHDNHRKNKDGNEKKMAGPQHQDHNLRLVYPTRDEIVRSVEGIMGGGSVPGRRSNVYKPFLQPLYHKWTSASTPTTTTTKIKVPSGREVLCDSDSSDEECNAPTVVADTDPLNKDRNVPHIKTYYQPTPDGQSMAWFVLSSHNLSKAAWGELQNGQWGETLKILHWELGVFLSPKLLGGGGEASRRLVAYNARSCRETYNKGGDVVVPLPYNFHPTPYSTGDQPWTVD